MFTHLSSCDGQADLVYWLNVIVAVNTQNISTSWKRGQTYFFFLFFFIGYLIIIIIIIISGECEETTDAQHVLETDAKGRNALHHACAAGNVKMITRFLNKGVSINVRTKDGETPLMRAALHGQVNAVSFLLTKGMFFTF